MPRGLNFSENPPASPGLYAIHINGYRLQRCLKLWEHNQCTVDVIRKHLSRIVFVMSNRTLTGTMCEVNKTAPPGIKFELNADGVGGDPLEIEHIPDKAIISIAKNATIWPQYLPPLYVGIAETQTLEQRINQHRLSLENTRDTASAFGVRARMAGLAWEDLTVQWIVANDASDLYALRELEKFLHATTHPVLSYR